MKIKYIVCLVIGILLSIYCYWNFSVEKTMLETVYTSKYPYVQVVTYNMKDDKIAVIKFKNVHFVRLWVSY